MIPRPMRHYSFATAVILLVTSGAVGCDHSPAGPSLDQLSLDVVSGDGQSAVVGAQLAPLIVKVTSAGNPVAGQVLNFLVVSGGGSVYGGTELTDSHGIAQELWTLGTNASQFQKVEVRAVDANTGAQKVFATFTANAVAGPATQIKVSAGDGQTAGVGMPVATAPAVLVADQYGNPVGGIAATFAIASGGGSIAGPNATSTSDGIAAAGSWTLGPTAGTNALTARSAGLAGSPLSFTATAVGPAGLNITNYRGDGQTQPAGTTLPVAPAVQVMDLGGHPVGSVQVVFSVTGGGGSITGATQVTDANGIATVGSWTLGPTAGVNELKAVFNTGVSRGSTIFVATAVPGNLWTTQAPLPTPLIDPAAVGIGTHLYVVGGESANDCTFTNGLEAYDPTADAWTAMTPMPTRRTQLGAGVLNGTLYAVGGFVGCGVTTNVVESYDPVANSWTALAPMPTARGTLGLGVANGKLYAIGGQTCCQLLDTVEVYNPTNNRWTTVSSMPTPRNFPAVAVVNGIIYAIGGSTQSGAVVGTVEAYDPVANTWTTRAPMPTPRYAVAAGVVNGIVYVVGGQAPSGSNGQVNTVEAYNPALNTWFTVASMPTVRGDLGGGVVNNVLYAVGGYTCCNGPFTPPLSTNEAYHP